MDRSNIAKNELQEYLQRMHPHEVVTQLMSYDSANVGGQYQATCYVYGVPFKGQIRSSKKEAEKHAALMVVEAIEADGKKFKDLGERYILNKNRHQPQPGPPLPHQVQQQHAPAFIPTHTTTIPSYHINPGTLAQPPAGFRAPPQPSAPVSQELSWKLKLENFVLEEYGRDVDKPKYKVTELTAGTFIAECNVLGVTYESQPCRLPSDAEQNAAKLAYEDATQVIDNQPPPPSPGFGSISAFIPTASPAFIPTASFKE
eukprot:PhF_6_TR13872/c0_g1_i2/m.22264